MNSATIGLNFAVEILKEQNGWEDGDEIITTPITFISTNHAIPRAGLKAVFADIDNTMCLNPESVKERITEKTRAVIFVGIGGNAGHYDDIVRICKERGLRLILDAAHMAGTRVSGKMPGHEADAVIYSFQAVKNLPTADSGMLCFKDGKLDEIARKKGWLGINKDTYTRTTNSGNYKWRYDVEYIGEKVENRDEVIVNLNRHGIYPGVHYADNTLYQMYAYDRGKCPYAAYVSEHILSLPMHLQLSYDDVQFISDRVIEIVNEFSQT